MAYTPAERAANEKLEAAIIEAHAARFPDTEVGKSHVLTDWFVIGLAQGYDDEGTGETAGFTIVRETTHFEMQVGLLTLMQARLIARGQADIR